MPETEKVVRIAKLFGVSLDELLRMLTATNGVIKAEILAG